MGFAKENVQYLFLAHLHVYLKFNFFVEFKCCHLFGFLFFPFLNFSVIFTKIAQFEPVVVVRQNCATCKKNSLRRSKNVCSLYSITVFRYLIA